MAVTVVVALGLGAAMAVDTGGINMNTGGGSGGRYTWSGLWKLPLAQKDRLLLFL